MGDGKRWRNPLRLYDNTRLSDFKRCPRFFFYRHILNWRATGTSVPLVFGGAWHSAMEVIWHHAKDDISNEKLAKAALGKWLETWCGEGMPSFQDMTYELEKALSPRTPGQAFEMIVAYIDERRTQIREDFEILAIEKPFIVPLDPEDDSLFYVGKIDKIFRYRKKIYGAEHKTTTAYKKNGPFKTDFVESFSPNSQVDGYLYALHMMFPDQVGGVWVDAALVHKTEEGFRYIPIEKQLKSIDPWIWETKEWIRQVEGHMDRVSHGATDKSDPYMTAFPKNTNACWDFFSACPYMYLCKSWNNPLGKSIPDGYIEERWDPLDHIKGLDKLVEEKAA